MASFAHRLTCVVIAFALSGSSPGLAVCMMLCLDSAVAATITDATQAGHCHDVKTESAVVSAHAHHGASASIRTGATVADASSLPASDAHLASTCDGCCITGPIAVAAGPGVERTDGKAVAMTPTVLVASIQLIATTHAAAPPGPPVPPPSPTRAPLALRI